MSSSNDETQTESNSSSECSSPPEWLQVFGWTQGEPPPDIILRLVEQLGEPPEFVEELRRQIEVHGVTELDWADPDPSSELPDGIKLLRELLVRAGPVTDFAEPAHRHVQDCEFCKEMAQSASTWPDFEPANMLQSLVKRAVDLLETEELGTTVDNEDFARACRAEAPLAPSNRRSRG